MTQRSQRLRKFTLGNPFGGLNSALPDHLLGNDMSPEMDGYVLKPEGIEAAGGWTKFTSQRLTDGAASPAASTVLKIDTYTPRSGTTYLVAITNKRTYYFNETTDLWIPITPGANASTTVNTDSPSGAKTLYVASTSGYAAGDTIIINEGGARQETAVVDSVAAGPTRLLLLANLTFTHTLAQADAVRRTYAHAIVDADSASGQAVLNVSHTSQFTVGEEVVIGMGTSREEIGFIQSISAGVSVTLTANMTYTHTAAQADKVYRIAGLSFTNTATEVDTENADNVFYWTDGANSIQQWSATGSPTFSSDLVGLRSGDSVEGIGTATSSVKAKWIRSFESFLVIAYTTEEGVTYPQKVRWCRKATPTSWANATDGSGQAGYFTFYGPDFIFRLQQLKRELMIHREKIVEGMTYVGPPDIFSFRRVVNKAGTFAHEALADLRDLQIILGPENAYAIDGVSAPNIGDDVKDAIFDAMNPSYKQFANVFYVDETAEAWFIIPTGSSRVGTKAWIWSALFKKWVGTRPLAGTAFGKYVSQSTYVWDSMVGTWDAATADWDSREFLANAPIILMGDNLGYIYIVDTTTTQDGNSFTRTYRTKRTDCGAPDMSKRILYARVGMRREGSGALSVYLGTSENEGDDMTWSDAQSLSLAGDTNGYVYFDQCGKFAQVKITGAVSSNLRSVELGFIEREDIL